MSLQHPLPCLENTREYLTNTKEYLSREYLPSLENRVQGKESRQRHRWVEGQPGDRRQRSRVGETHDVRRQKVSPIRSSGVESVLFEYIHI